MDKIKNMVPSIVESCLETMEKWNLSLASNKSIEVDMVPEIDALIVDIMSKTVVAGRISEETRRMYQLRNTVNQQAVKLAKLMYFPGRWNLPTQEVKTLKAAHKEIQSLVKKVVTRRLDEMKNGAGNQGDILSLIYSEWQERAREEVLQVFGDQKPNVEGLKQLTIVTMIMYEALRLYPPTGLVHRSISRDTKLGDMVLPAWIQVTIPITLMNHDPDIWGEDVKQFKPERFKEGISNSKMQSIFFAFSGGPRKSIGQSMAMHGMKLVLRKLV
ncbi:Cytochrome [Heracleum sosnowskyi]|uniref:Cytochrome n=1 Tax=Heracleum sosnowskyi TaxID=360622 RepID=A0AAD8IHJ4_9APIA|nr:Cytochrome [Heracleum sosnowskyi]